jgi:hypothetical protein
MTGVLRRQPLPYSFAFSFVVGNTLDQQINDHDKGLLQLVAAVFGLDVLVIFFGCVFDFTGGYLWLSLTGATVMAMLYAQVSLLGVWAVMGRSRWQVRVVGSAACVVLLIAMMHYYEPSDSNVLRFALAFGVQWVSIVGTLFVATRLAVKVSTTFGTPILDSIAPPRFLILDVVRWIAVLAASMSVARSLALSYSITYWQMLDAIVIGLSFGSSALAVAWLQSSSKHLLPCIAMLCSLTLPLTYFNRLGIDRLAWVCFLFVQHGIWLAAVAFLMRRYVTAGLLRPTSN